MNRTLISWEEFKEKEYDKPKWLINPYIPAGGAIIFFWGETSTGKSPFGWHVAAAVGNGGNFFGLPANEGKVLYLEVDTPEMLVHERVKKLEPAHNVDFLFLPPLSVPEPSPADQAMLDRAAARNYDLVIVNTLRKVHNLDDKEPTTPKVVYSYFQAQFAGSSLMFVHHTKKTQQDNPGRLKENFSGAMNWVNDAQVGIALTKFESEAEGINIRLNHEKSQVSDEYQPLGLKLERDGATLRCPKFENLLLMYEWMNAGELEKAKSANAFDIDVSQRLGISIASAYRLRKLIEERRFPGVEWLGRKRDAEG